MRGTRFSSVQSRQVELQPLERPQGSLAGCCPPCSAAMGTGTTAYSKTNTSALKLVGQKGKELDQKVWAQASKQCL